MELDNKPNLSCILCDQDFQCENDMLVHINSSEHLTKKRNKQENDDTTSNDAAKVLSDLFCEICSVAVPNPESMAAHRNGKKHFAKVQLLKKEKQRRCGIFVRGYPVPPNQQQLLALFNRFGKVTSYVFQNSYLLLEYENEESVAILMRRPRYFQNRRLTINHRTPSGSTEDPVATARKSNEELAAITAKLRNIDAFTDEVSLLLDNLKPDFGKYQLIYNDINAVLVSKWPQVRVYLFGSTITGLNFANSDIDVYIKADQQENDEKQSQYLSLTKKMFEKSGRFSQILLINARTPILKCTHLVTNIKVDINFRSLLGVCNSHLIAAYTKLDEKIRVLMIIIKYWAKSHNLTGQNNLFSSYCLCLLIIFFLQQEPYCLPTVYDLQKVCPPFNCESWNGTVTPIAKEYTPAASVNELLKDFFKFYSKFPFDTQIICPYLGKSFNRTTFLTSNDTTDFFKLEVIENVASLKLGNPVCLQDPMELVRNATLNVLHAGLNTFVAYCNLGYTLCEEKSSNLLYSLFINVAEPAELKNAHIQVRMERNSGYLLKGATKELLDDPRKIREAWFDVVIEFVKTVFTDFLLFETVEVSDENQSLNKKQRIDGHDDVYSSETKKVTFNCTGKLNLWDNRAVLRQALKLNNYKDVIEIEKSVSKQMYESYKDKCVEKLIGFDVSLELVHQPCHVKLFLVKKESYKRAFKSFVQFFRSQLPKWFEVYECDLNRENN